MPAANQLLRRLTACFATLTAASLALAQNNAIPGPAPANPNNLPQRNGMLVGPATAPPLKPALATPWLRFAPDQPLGAAVVALPPVDHDELLAEDAARAAIGQADPLRTAIALPVGLALADLPAGWNDVPGGRIWLATVHAPQALAVRALLRDVQLPAGAELWITDARGAAIAGPYHDRGHSGDGVIWSPIVPGDTLQLQLFTPAAVPAADLTLDSAQHFYRDPAAPISGDDPSRADCLIDAMCDTNWHPLHNATARMVISDSTGAWLCSGTLLNTLAQDYTPYFLTANHCVNTPEEAASIQLFWFYQTIACDGAVSPYITDNGGGTIVATNGTCDETLVLMKGVLPANLTWAGWNTVTQLDDGTDLVGISHPGGKRKKISYGDKRTHPWGDSFNYWGITWTSGTIEGGSSGSACYLAATQEVIGVASHSEIPVGCDNPDGPSGYGKFGRFYPQISTALQIGPDDALEANDYCGEAVALAVQDYDDLTVKLNNDDWYELQVAPCQRLRVIARFVDAYGDVDLDLYDACNGNIIASAHSADDDEVLLYDHLTAPQSVYLRVHLADGVRNNYALEIDLLAGGDVTITTQPLNQSACPGGSASYTVAATGEQLAYQWRKDGANLVDDGVSIIGATTDTLLLNNLTSGAAGGYSVVVTGGVSGCTATSNIANLTLGTAPTIAQQPVSQTVDAGTNVFFNVSLVSPLSPVYQWRRNGQPLIDNGHVVGSTTATLIILAAQPADSGSYDCVISDVPAVYACDATSDAATLTVGGGAVCAGDLTGDSRVDFADFSQLSSCWNQPCGDLTGDATTDFADFSALSADWGCDLN